VTGTIETAFIQSTLRDWMTKCISEMNIKAAESLSHVVNASELSKIREKVLTEIAQLEYFSKPSPQSDVTSWSTV
jgi:hypothetical protein